jgi:hypothetical protein
VTDPDAPPTLLDVVRRAGRALDDRGVRWALVGGLAVSIRTEPRFTRDVDLVVAVPDDAAAEALVADFGARGYRLVTILEQQALGRLATVRLAEHGSTDAGIVLDLLFASTGIEGEISRAAETLEVARGLRVPVATAGHLVAMKLLSRADHRLQDDVDLQHLHAVLSAEDIRLARDGVARIEAVGANRGRTLAEDLERYLAGGSPRRRA